MTEPKVFNVPINMLGFELLNARAQNLAAPPAGAGEGAFVYDSVRRKFVIRDDADWYDPTDRTEHHGQQPSSTISDFEAAVLGFPLNRFTPPAQNVNLNAKRITALADGADPQDAATIANLADVRDDIETASAAELAARTVSSWLPADGDVDLNGHRILRVLAGSGALDAVNRTQLDGVATAAANALAAKRLDQLVPPQADVAFNGQHITGLAAGAAPTDGANVSQVTAVLTALQGWRLDQLVPPTAAVTLSGQKITALANGTAATDAVNRGQLDAAAAATQTAASDALAAKRLDQLVAPEGDVTLNGHRIIALADGTGAADAVNRAQLDGVASAASAALAAKRLDQLVAPTGPVTLNSQRITNLAASAAPTDAVNQSQLTTAVANLETSLSGWRLDQLVPPTANVNLNSQRIVALADGTAAGDAVNRGQLDAASQAATNALAAKRLDQLVAPLGAVNMATQRLVNLADGADPADAVNFGQLTAVSTALANKRLDQLVAPTGPVTLNGQKIVALAAGTVATDAVNFGQLTAVETAASAALAAKRLDQLVAPTGSVNLNTQKIIALAPGTAATDAVNRGQLDAVATAAQTALTAYRLDQLVAPTGPVTMNGQKLTNVANGTAATDVVNRGQLDAVAAGALATTLDKFSPPVAAMNFNGQKLTNIGAATAPTDVPSYGQVMALANGMDYKTSARLTSTGSNIPLTGVTTIDGKTPANGDRVLLRHQTDRRQNLIYDFNNGNLTVAADSANGALSSGAIVAITDGDSLDDTAWRLITNDPIVVGTTQLDWDSFAKPFVPVEGEGVKVVGSVIAVDTARVARIAGADVGDGNALTYVVQHGFGKKDVLVQVFRNDTGAEEIADVNRISNDAVRIGFGLAPAANAYRVVVHG